MKITSEYMEPMVYADQKIGYAPQRGEQKEMSHSQGNLYKDHLKRGFDLILSLGLIVLLSPPLLLIALIIKISEPNAPVIFRQIRSGKDRVPFMLYKFRTMSLEAPPDEPTNRLTNRDCHITKIGKFLRLASIDEMPQLFNILKGEMSFVGPRPVVLREKALLHYRDLVNANSVLPGITGLAQINGRDYVSIKDKAKLDGEYASKISFFLDLYLLLMTVPTVISQKGIIENCVDDPTKNKDE